LQDAYCRQRLVEDNAPYLRVGKKMPEQLQIRVHGNASQPTLVYLPGLHGDWTLVGNFRRALNGRLRFVELTYPRSLEWSLEDYATAVEAALFEKGIERGWLLGESFGSQIVWPLMARRKFGIEGVILAGGFVRHPARWAARLAGRIGGGISLALLTRIMFGYAKLARFRFRNSPQMRAEIGEFVARRTERDRQAAVHRLHLIAQSDPRPVARQTSLPVCGLTGVLDPIVPWIFILPWLRGDCPALREYRVIWHADHNVLGTAPKAAAELVLQWMNG
jgi:pimeloyl-ACP methyl ester carboxylesterase